MLSSHSLCDSCLGRQFALLGNIPENVFKSKNLSPNACRGFSLKMTLTLQDHLTYDLGSKDEGIKSLKILAENGNFEPARETLTMLGKNFDQTSRICYLCDGKIELNSEHAEKAIASLTSYEFETFLCGSVIPIHLKEREDELRSKFNIKWGEALKSEINRETGKMIAKITGKQADLANPDVATIIDIESGQISTSINPLFIYGRYRKLIRGIPQSKWPCKCEGIGCSVCNWTGKKYAISVEELITTPILELTDAKDAKFHGSGREDIDARMLGKGRPFIVEIKEPKRRKLNLMDLENRIRDYANGKVEVTQLKFTKKDMVRKIKAISQHAEKIYKCSIRVDRDISLEDVEKIKKELTNATIQQRTPLRVSHRRVDKIRMKKIHDIDAKIDGNLMELVIRCDGGLYIKELISGDGGRTTPSISELLSASAECLELDVLEVQLD